LFYCLAGYGRKFWPLVPDALIEDFSDYQTAKILGVKVWELDSCPLYWVERCRLFEAVIPEVRKHLDRNTNS
jgi:hypothetical protein